MLRDHGARRPDRAAKSAEERIGKLLEAPRRQGKRVGRKLTSSAETEISLAFSSASWQMNRTICWICLETSASFILAAADPTCPPAALLAPATAARGGGWECWSGAAAQQGGGAAGSPREWSRRGGRGASLAAGAT